MKFLEHKHLNKVADQRKGSALREESSLHQISPYIGKMKSSMAKTLISTYTRASETIYDPFSGSGTVAFEAWAAGRNIIANDLSPYAIMLTQAKLFPFSSIEEAIGEIDNVASKIDNVIPSIDLRTIPKWVRAFFHPDTLREIIAWLDILKSKKSYFLISCLLGILHHQRPGFLSYPSSHTVPYLREKKFARDKYPELYQYRSVQDRFRKKVIRAFKRLPKLDEQLIRKCYEKNAATFVPEFKINTIMTSPPYMRQLDYARDNRLRLWFLGVSDWKKLDRSVSPSEGDFLSLFSACLKLWHNALTPKGLCVLVLGDTYCRTYDMQLPEVVAYIATKEIGGYAVHCKHKESIPNDRRVRRGCLGSLTETILVLRKS